MGQKESGFALRKEALPFFFFSVPGGRHVPQGDEKCMDGFVGFFLRSGIDPPLCSAPLSSLPPLINGSCLAAWPGGNTDG